jgi:hypothetical protein
VSSLAGRVRRLRLLLLIALGLIIFVAVSGVLARILSVPSAERSAITGLLQAQARGDAAGMVRQIYRCDESAACRQRAALDAAELRRPGSVKILELNASAGFSLGSTLGTARVAWRAGNALPVVQCVLVRRAGNAFSGLRVELREISRRIKSDRPCPARY